MGTAGLLGCGDAEIRASGNLGLGARLRVCRATEMDAGGGVLGCGTAGTPSWGGFWVLGTGKCRREGCGIQGRRAAHWKDSERRAKDAGALRDCGAGKGAGGGDEELMGRAGPGRV